MIDWIAFDADDTLWHNERVYREGRQRFRDLLAKYDLEGDLDQQFNTIEIRNLKYYGYGVMSFVLSQIEAAIQLTGGEISAGDIQSLIELSKEMLTTNVVLFEHSQRMVEDLSADFPLMLITKGDLAHQQRKVEKSGLESHFKSIEVVSEKTTAVYEQILDQHGIPPSRFLMVGNSIRSDIRPVLELGGWAIHVAPHLSWDHEGGEVSSRLADRFRAVDGLEDVVPVIRELATASLPESGPEDTAANG